MFTKPTKEQQEFMDWAESRGLSAHLQTIYPRDEEDFEPFTMMSLVVEEIIDGQLHAYVMEPIVPTAWPEARQHLENLLRLSFERYKEVNSLG